MYIYFDPRTDMYLLILFGQQACTYVRWKVVATSIPVLMMYDGKVLDTPIAILPMYIKYNETDMYLQYRKYDVLFV